MVFFTKKQKAELRKRKRRLEVKHKKEGTGDAQPKQKPKNDNNATMTTTSNSNSKSVDENGQVVAATDNQSTIVNNAVVVIPKNLSSQEAKKFRKDARRKARAEGRDIDQIEFVVEGSQTTKRHNCVDDNNNSNNDASGQQQQQQHQPKKKKRKRDFPCLNELVEQERKERAKLEHTQALQSSEEILTDDYKARYLALDCEMVGIGTDGKKSVLARASLVDWNGDTVFDSFVQVPTRVSDFRTHVSGVTAADIRANKGAMKDTDCRQKVAELLKGKVLVGHALKNDLHALLLTHPKADIRDTAKYRPFQRLGGNKWRPRKLRDLVKENLGLAIQQEGQAHDSTEDAKATMMLFRSAREQWERELEEKASLKKRKTT